MSTSKVTIAFYNLENLFDTQNDPHIFDDDYTADGDLHWDQNRYDKKIDDLAGVISQLGLSKTGDLPCAIGLAEVENKKVLNDLTAHPLLKEHDFAYRHFNSPDERGMDTAFLYRKSVVEVIHAEPVPLTIHREDGSRDATRDILYVQGKLCGVETHFFVNHWPSRGEGEDISRPKRIQAAIQLRQRIDRLVEKDPEARIVVMGDFNDNPNSLSVKRHLVKNDFYNPMVFLLTCYAGSLSHKLHWFMFDQIILSNNWMKSHDNPLVYDKAEIYAPDYLREEKGKYAGTPFRTYAGDHYLGGPSDHFPVFVAFELVR